MSLEQIEARDSSPPPEVGELRRPLSLVDAFELGFVWRGQLTGQTLEDSRAVGRTLMNPMFDLLNLDLDGFNSFESADLGIVDGKKRIGAALNAADAAGVSALLDRVEGLEAENVRLKSVIRAHGVEPDRIQFMNKPKGADQ